MIGFTPRASGVECGGDGQVNHYTEAKANTRFCQAHFVTVQVGGRAVRKDVSRN